jgi:hypothetical protein
MRFALFPMLRVGGWPTRSRGGSSARPSGRDRQRTCGPAGAGRRRGPRRALRAGDVGRGQTRVAGARTQGLAGGCGRRRLPAQRETAGQPPKERGAFALELVENPDVLSELSALGRSELAIGFALESFAREGAAAAEERARSKMARKGLDAIVLNEAAAMGVDGHRAPMDRCQRRFGVARQRRQSSARQAPRHEDRGATRASGRGGVELPRRLRSLTAKSRTSWLPRAELRRSRESSFEPSCPLIAVRRSLLLFLVLCLCSLLGSAFAPGRELRAQHVVDAKGGGTHIDLQAAIDQARPGDRIRVRGGVWQRIVIRKSLTLIGDPMPTLTAPFNGVGTGLRQPPALELDGNGSEVLRLVDVRIEGLALGSGSWSSQSAAIEVDDWGRLELVRCHIRAMEWWSVTGLANGAPGIRVEGDLFLNATDSWIQASSSIGHAWVPPSNVDGAAGIDAPEADVLLVGSTVLGGAGPDFVLFGCPTQPCPCPQFRHRGGDAVRAERLWSYGASLQPGPGGQLSCWNGVSFQKGGRQVEGRRFVGRPAGRCGSAAVDAAAAAGGRRLATRARLAADRRLPRHR